jgi:hypothetical protein
MFLDAAHITYAEQPRILSDVLSPFDPSERPFVLFKGNTAHSKGYFWEHNAAVYVGGMLFYKTDSADGQVRWILT